MSRLHAWRWLLVVAFIVGSGLGACARRRAPSPAPSRDAATAPRAIVWEHDETAAIARAIAAQKGLMVNLQAAWCVPCVELERLLNEDRIYEAVTDHFVPLRLDVSEDGPESQGKKRRFGVSGSLPALIFFNIHDDGRQLLVAIGEDTPGYLEPEGLLRAVDPAVTLQRRQRSGN